MGGSAIAGSPFCACLFGWLMSAMGQKRKLGSSFSMSASMRGITTTSSQVTRRGLLPRQMRA